MSNVIAIAQAAYEVNADRRARGYTYPAIHDTDAQRTFESSLGELGRRLSDGEPVAHVIDAMLYADRRS